MGRTPRPRRFPLVRLGLLLVVGSLMASVFRFYIGLGESLSSMSGDAPSTESRDLARYFLSDFLFAGTAAGLLFWGGIALCIAGSVRRLRAGRDRAARSDGDRAGPTAR